MPETETPVLLPPKATWDDVKAATASGVVRLQSIIEKNFKARTEPVKHDKTAVLLLHWDKKACDMDVSGELNELKNVFERHYHFEVIQQKIMAKAHPRPEHQLRKFLTDFIHNFDSPHTLYIIYYAGHGWAGDDLGHLNLAGSTSQTALSKHEINTAVWNNAERCIQDTKSDILVVFDCCDAGALHSSYRGLHSFEFLGACDKGEIAPSPGNNSFTSAMIWALRELANEGSGFDSSDLKARLESYTDFERDKIHPVLFHRFQSSGAHVWIEPMQSQEESPTNRSRARHYREETADAAAEWADFRLWFNRGQSDEDFASLFMSLNEHAQKIGLRRITAQKRSGDPRLVKGHASFWQQWTRQRLSSSQLTQLEDTETGPILVETALESQYDLTPVIDRVTQCLSPLSGPEEMQNKDMHVNDTAHQHLTSPTETKQKRKGSGQSPLIQSSPKRRRI